jgi:calcineurin-like phosphoesterase family protein
MSRVLIISDTHFGHRNICNYRPEFSSMDEHDETIIENIVKTVKKRDTLWLLGDCFFTADTEKYVKRIAATGAILNFIPGNHDTDTNERIDLFKSFVNQGYFNKVGSLFRVGKYWLSHPPIHQQELYGKKNIHGHVHRKTVSDENYINVSCENIRYVPVNLQNIESSLIHYGNYTHNCEDFQDKHNKCLVCNRDRR